MPDDTQALHERQDLQKLQKLQAQRDAHWHSNLCLTAALLLVWFGISFVVAFFARELNARWFGWPVSFWVAAQGAPLVYVLMVTLYARHMRRQDLRVGDAHADDNRR